MLLVSTGYSLNCILSISSIWTMCTVPPPPPPQCVMPRQRYLPGLRLRPAMAADDIGFVDCMFDCRVVHTLTRCQRYGVVQNIASDTKDGDGHEPCRWSARRL